MVDTMAWGVIQYKEEDERGRKTDEEEGIR